jgi:hypothetical protein
MRMVDLQGWGGKNRRYCRALSWQGIAKFGLKWYEYGIKFLLLDKNQ